MSQQKPESNLFNICLSASADFASYQAGICQFLYEHYDVCNSPRVLVSGASSGALNGALLLLGDLDPLENLCARFLIFTNNTTLCFATTCCT